MSPVAGTPKGAGRREAVLDAAVAILVEGGSAALTLRSVAERVGIRLSNVQYYFPTREDLLAAVPVHHLDRTIQSLSGPLSGLPLDEVVRLVLAHQTDRATSVLFTELWALAGHHPQVEAAVRAYYRQYEDLVVEQLTAAMPGLGAGEAAARARVFVLVMEGATLFRGGVAGDAEPASDEILQRVAAGLLH